MIELYEDQQQSIDKLRVAMRRYKRIILQGETGSGKSVMGSFMIQASQSKGFRSAFCVPRKDLLFQMDETFNEFDIPHSFVADKHPFNPFLKTHICTTGTLVNRMDLIKPNLVFIDEAHFGGAQNDKVINHFAANGAWIIGLTASPEKTDGRGLDEHYQYMIEGPTIRELIDKKRLSNYRLFAPDRPDFSKVKKNKDGEYNQAQLAEKMKQDRVLVGNAVKHYKDHAMGKLNITFCTSIENSQMTAELFRNAGVPTMHIDGTTPEADRRRIARAFARRELLNLCSVDLMTFGYDLSAASGIKNVTIESMSDLRPTLSLPLQRQKNGRVLRYKEQPAIIFDHSGNYIAHGYPDDRIAWSLAGREKNSRGYDEEKEVRMKRCNKCDFVHPPGPPKCPNCGNVYEIQSRTVEHVEGELFEIDPTTARLRAEKERKKRLEALIGVAFSQGRKNPIEWAAKKLTEEEVKKRRGG